MPYISRIRREETPWGIVMKIGLGGHMGDVITPAIFYRYPIRGSGVTGHGKMGLAIWTRHGPYNSAQTTVWACDNLLPISLSLFCAYFIY